MSNIKIIPATYYTNNNERIVFIDGNTCDTIEKCYTTLQQQLSIPDYFGHNLDALEEVIADAEWITEEKIHIVILNEKDLLKNDLSSKNNFLDIIKNNDNEKIFVSVLGK
jgi:RNAse (barnase) inhibitor barstar